MALTTLHDLYIAQLQELYSAEKHAAKVLPNMEKSASDPELADAFHEHVEQTQQQVERLERIFEQLGKKPRGHETQGMKGLLQDCLDLARRKDAEPHVRDAALIAVAQHVEHDEIAGYGCARTWATLLGEDEAAQILQTTLAEEKETDQKLNRIAERLNQEAVEAPAG